MVDLTDALPGTPHPTARCCWCASPLVVGTVLALKAWLCPVDWRRQVKHAVIVTAHDPKHAKLLGVGKGEQVCLNVPLPSQVLFEECAAKNVLWGGQAGPGKSHGVRWWLYKRSLTTPNHEALLLRENWDQLEKTHIRKMEREVPLLGGEFSNRTARFPHTNAIIDCGHMADADSVSRYLSTEYGAIVPEEASLYPTDSEGTTPLAELSTRARKAYRTSAGVIVPPRFMPVTNPGGPSAAWLAQMFVDHAPDYEKFPRLRPVFEHGVQVKGYRPEQWAYLPAKLADNPYMREDYGDTDLGVLTGVRYQQLAEGDWHVFSGQFFAQWRESIHVADLGTPSHVRWFRSMDWGYNAPGCLLWWAILPDHRLYIRAELKFQRMDEPEVAAAAKKIDLSLGRPKIAYTAGDPAVFNKTGATHRAPGFIGQSIGETLGHYGLPITHADNERVNGWKRCHSLLRLAPDGTPWLVVHPYCTYLIRSIAAARSDKTNADDVDTKSDDHALDAWRYGAMSRPAVQTGTTSRPAPKGTPGYIVQEAQRVSRGRSWGKVA